MHKSWVIVFGVVVMAMGCVVDDDVSVSETEQALKPKPGDGTCGSYGCGQNTPDIDGIGFTILHEKGLANPQEIRIKEFKAQAGGTGAMTVRTADVRNGELLARDSNGQITERGPQLNNAEFLLENVKTHELHRLIVAEVGVTPMWTVRTANTWSYLLHYVSTVGGRRLNLCKQAGTPALPGEPMNPFEAVLFDDDRINEEKLAFETPVANWFTIGCAGSALAKVHLMGKTAASSAILNIPTTLFQRTAALKMLTADYCGGGWPFTVAGIPLHYRDNEGIMNSVVAGEAVEARFSENGATCLNKPRIVAHGTAQSLLVFPSSSTEQSFKAYIATYCALPPPCSPPTYTVGYPYGAAWMLSTNPP